MITLVAYERSNDLPASLWSSCITFVCGLLLVVGGGQTPYSFALEICTC